MSKLSVGDVCIVVKTILNHELRGAECVVTSVGLLGYEVRMSGEGHERYAFPFQLRKKPPESDCNQVTSWQDCIWSPARERA